MEKKINWHIKVCKCILHNDLFGLSDMCKHLYYVLLIFIDYDQKYSFDILYFISFLTTGVVLKCNTLKILVVA